MGVVVLKELILTVSTLGGCGALEIADFLTVSIFGGCGGPERSDEKIFLGPNSSPIDAMLKLLTILCNLMKNNINKSESFSNPSNITK